MEDRAREALRKARVEHVLPVRAAAVRGTNFELPTPHAAVLIRQADAHALARGRRQRLVEAVHEPLRAEAGLLGVQLALLIRAVDAVHERRARLRTVKRTHQAAARLLREGAPAFEEEAQVRSRGLRTPEKRLIRKHVHGSYDPSLLF